MKKIACVTDDGTTISQHFGRAQYYAIVTVEDGEIVDRELRSKFSHTNFSSQGHAVTGAGQRRGMDPASQAKHASMAEVISDCEALLCRGMGYGAYHSMEEAGIKPVVTDEPDVDSAVMTYIAGDLVDHTELLH